MYHNSFMTSYSNLSRLDTTVTDYDFIGTHSEQIEKIYRPPEEFVRMKHEVASSSREILQALANLQKDVDNLPAAIQSRCLTKKEQLKELQKIDEQLTSEIATIQAELSHLQRENDVMTAQQEARRALEQLEEDILQNYELATKTATSNLEIVFELEK